MSVSCITNSDIKKTPNERERKEAPSYPSQLLAGSFTGLGFFPVGLFLSNVGSQLTKEDLSQSRFILKELEVSKFKPIKSAVIVAPILEEVLFRGIGIKGIKMAQEALGFDSSSRGSKVVRGSILTGLFAAMHMDMSQFNAVKVPFAEALKQTGFSVLKANKRILAVTGILGGICQYQAETTEGLAEPIATHAVYNGLTMATFFASLRRK